MIWLPVPNPYLFDAAPVWTEVAKGRTAFDHRRDWTGNDRVALGWWFNGNRMEDTDEIIWLSPALVSRRLGYLQAMEGWPDAEVSRRWTLAKSMLDGQYTFIARVCAFPRRGVLEEEDTPPERPDRSRNLIVTLTAGQGRVGVVPNYLRSDDGRTAFDVVRAWTAEPLVRHIFASRYDTYLPEAFSFGDYHSTWILLQSPTCKGQVSEVRLTIFDGKSAKSAVFKPFGKGRRIP